MSRAGSQLGLSKDREAGEVTQVAPCRASSRPQCLSGCWRLGRTTGGNQRQGGSNGATRTCSVTVDKSLNFPETRCPRPCESAVAVRTRGQCECLGCTWGTQQVLIHGSWGLRSSKRLSTPAAPSHRPCSCSPSGWGVGRAAPAQEGFTQFSPPPPQRATHASYDLSSSRTFEIFAASGKNRSMNFPMNIY